MSKDKKQYKSIADLPMWAKMLTGGLAGCVAEVFSILIIILGCHNSSRYFSMLNIFPILKKVRMQIQKPLADGTYKYTGLLKGTKMIFQEEGILALYKGLGAGF